MSDLTNSYRFNLSGYSSRHKRVAELLTEIRTLATSIGSASGEFACASGIQDLSDETFRIVVVGEFSRGKSTLINALLGACVLPTGAQPVTTILNHIRFGDQLRFRVVKRDGQNDELTQEEFRKIVAPPSPDPSDPSSAQLFQDAIEQISRISHAEVFYPSPLCRNGVEIIDTPGTNDVDTIREQITYDFIPRADVILFLLSACEPIGASEMVFLRERVLRSDVQRIFFPVTFADQLETPADRENVRRHIEKQLTPVVGSPRLFFVDSYAAMKLRLSGEAGPQLEETGIPPLEEALASFLVAERAIVKLRRPVFRGVRACQELRDHALVMGDAALSIEARELQLRIDAAKPKISAYRFEQERVVYQFYTEMLGSVRPILVQISNDLTGIAHSAGDGLRRIPVDTDAQMREVIEKATAAKHTAMQNAVAHMRDEAIGRAFRRAASALDLRRTEIESSVTGSVAVAEDLTFRTISSDYRVRVEQAAGMSGTLGKIFLVITKFIGGFSSELGKELEKAVVGFLSSSDKLANKVEREYLNGILKTQQEFEKQWSALASRIANDIKNDSELRMNDLTDQLMRLHAEADANETERECSRQKIRDTSQRLSILEAELRNLGGWSHE